MWNVRKLQFLILIHVYRVRVKIFKKNNIKVALFT